MAKRFTVENILREPYELYSAVVIFCAAFLLKTYPHFFLMTTVMVNYSCALLITLGLFRLFQSYRIMRYQNRLLRLPRYALSTQEVPLSKDKLFVGRGFSWQPHHTQRLHMINQVENERYLQPDLLYRSARKLEDKFPNTHLERILSLASPLNPVAPQPDVGGKPWLHGLGDHERNIFIPKSNRTGHCLVLGTTRVGKTRLSSTLVNQDIRCGDAVIFIDPKGDLDIMKDMYSACLAAGRLNDFQILHAGFPELSALYNPLSSYEFVSEVATRITNAIPAGSNGAVFKDFAWKYLNIVAICLEEMGEAITYKNISFFITRLDELLIAYADSVMPRKDPEYLGGVDKIKRDRDNKIDKHGNKQAPISRAQAIKTYLAAYIEEKVSQGVMSELHDQIIVDLHNAATLDKQYYDKITANAGPVLSKINQGAAANIFSFDKKQNDKPEINLMDVIRNKKVVYIGLDALSNEVISRAIGMALISDLVSTSGKIYKQNPEDTSLCLHADEFSEIVQDQFVTLLNKAGGAGVKVTAYAQTINDIESAFQGNCAKAKMLEGNLNSLIMMRVKNKQTAELLTEQLPSVDVLASTQVSSVSDTPEGKEGVFFNTSNEDRLQKNTVPMLTVNDIVSLPKGQAFVFINGGELYKVRIPLPKNDGLAPKDIKDMMLSVKLSGEAHD